MLRARTPNGVATTMAVLMRCENVIERNKPSASCTSTRQTYFSSAFRLNSINLSLESFSSPPLTNLHVSHRYVHKNASFFSPVLSMNGGNISFQSWMYNDMTHVHGHRRLRREICKRYTRRFYHIQQKPVVLIRCRTELIKWGTEKRSADKACEWVAELKIHELTAIIAIFFLVSQLFCIF